MSAITDPWIPRGLVGSATVVADSAAITTTVTTIVSVDVGVLAGRSYPIIASAFGATTSIAGDRFNWSIAANGTQVGSRRTKIYDTARGSNDAPDMTRVYTAAATGTVTFAFRVVRAAGTGNIIVNASAADPAEIHVFDSSFAP